MALTEKEFSMIKKKMDKIDHHLNEMYKNWHAGIWKCQYSRGM